MILIELTKLHHFGEPNKIYVNPLFIVGMTTVGDDTIINMTGNTVYEVKETPAEVMAIIDKCGLKEVMDKLGLNGLI